MNIQNGVYGKLCGQRIRNNQIFYSVKIVPEAREMLTAAHIRVVKEIMYRMYYSQLMFWFVFKEKAHPSVSLPDVWAQVDYYSPVQVINYKAEI